MGRGSRQQRQAKHTGHQGLGELQRKIEGRPERRHAILAGEGFSERQHLSKDQDKEQETEGAGV